MLLLSILFITHRVFAQLPDYYVYLVKGEVTVSDQKEKHRLQQGEFLYKSALLIFTGKSELTLVNKDAEYFVLDAAHNMKLALLQQVKAKSYSGITKKYLHLVWDEVLDPGYDFTKFKSKNLTGVYGGVSRSDECKNMIFPVNGLKTAAPDLNFKWLQTSASGKYNLLLYDGSGNEILNKPVEDTQMVFSIESLNLAFGKYYWLIKSNDTACEDEVPLYFELLSDTDENKLVTSITSASDPDDLAGRLDIIDKLEKNALIYAAKKYYSETLSKYKGNDALNRMYVMFLLNYGFDSEAAQQWNSEKQE